MKHILTSCSTFVVKPLVHFSGYGEPLLYPHIEETMAFCHDKRLTWSITTNASVLTEYIEDVVSNECYTINVSLHGTATEHDQITGVSGAFDRAFNAILMLDKLKKQQHKRTPYLAINCVITNENVTHLKNIQQTFQRLPVSSITFSHLHFSRDLLMQAQPRNTLGASPVLDQSYLPNLHDFIQFLEQTPQPIKTFFYPRISRKDLSRYYTATRDDFTNACVFPWLSVDVYPQGTVHICRQVLGTIESGSLQTIVNNARARAFRTWVKRGKRGAIAKPPNCFRCPHRHYS